MEAEPNGLTFSIWHDDDTLVAEAQSKEDAAFIVRACNSHDALLALFNHLDHITQEEATVKAIANSDHAGSETEQRDHARTCHLSAKALKMETWKFMEDARNALATLPVHA